MLPPTYKELEKVLRTLITNVESLHLCIGDEVMGEFNLAPLTKEARSIIERIDNVRAD